MQVELNFETNVAKASLLKVKDQQKKRSSSRTKN